MQDAVLGTGGTKMKKKDSCLLWGCGVGGEQTSHPEALMWCEGWGDGCAWLKVLWEPEGSPTSLRPLLNGLYGKARWAEEHSR